MLNRTYNQARGVEIALETLIGQEDLKLDSYPYCNGRERGFCFVDHNSNRSVFVAEARNSDEIILVCSDRGINEWCNIKEEEYNDRSTVDFGNFMGAAHKIIGYLADGDEI